MNDQQHTQPLHAGAPGSPTTDPQSQVLPDRDPAADAWRHPVNTGHLVMGVAFAGFLLVWALLVSDIVEMRDIQWLMPLPWVIAGAVGLTVATSSSIRSRRRPG